MIDFGHIFIPINGTANGNTSIFDYAFHHLRLFLHSEENKGMSKLYPRPNP